MKCASLVLAVTQTQSSNSFLASRCFQSVQTLEAGLVSQQNEILLSNTSGLQRREGLQGHLDLTVICLRSCSLGLCSSLELSFAGSGEVSWVGLQIALLGFRGALQSVGSRLS